jgi:putative ABC transport system permease protein
MALFARLQSLLQRRKVERDLDEELQFHIELKTRENLEAGMPPEEARLAALRAFGGVEQKKEECRDEDRWRVLDDVAQDIRYGLRMLAKNPGFTVVAVITLALGIGANTAIFSLANAVFFRGFPFPHAERLAFLWQNNHKTGESEEAVSYPNYADWRAQSRTFADMAFICFGKEFLTGSGTKGALAGPKGPERVSGATVSTNFFAVLGVSPRLGRSFIPEDASEGHSGVAVISYALWQERFGSNPQVVGQSLKLGGEKETIVGVMPRGFSFPNGVQFWRPRVVNAFLQTKARQYPNMAVIARRKAGVTWSQAQAEMDTIAARLASEYRSVDSDVGIRVIPLREQLSEKVRGGIVLLWGAIAGLLLIACLNTASLMVGRSAARQKEIAVRLSLGATRQRLARQLVTESSALAAAGTVAGLGLAMGAVRLVSRLDPDISELHGTIFDIRVLGYTAAVAVIAALVCGVLPVLTVPQGNVNRALKDNSSAMSPATHLTRKALTVAEVAMAFVLLTGSVFMVRSLWGILHVDPGFDAKHILAFHVYWPDTKDSKESAASDAHFADLMARLRSLPGVASVGSASFVLFPDEMFMVPFQVEGQPPQPSNQQPLISTAEATPNFFRAMGIPLLRGREFTAADSAKDAPPVAIINLRMARRYWPNEEPLGKRFKFADPNFKSPWFTVVGIVGDVREQGLENPASGMAYVPSPGSRYDDLVIRAKGDPLALGAMVRNEIGWFDKNLIVDNMTTARSMLVERESHREFTAWLLETFALCALILAAVGIYGVLAYWVGQRTQEIGVRMALGARSHDVLAMVVGQGMNVAILGVLIGVAAALGLSRFLSGLIYGVKPNEPWGFVIVSVVFGMVALLACYIPARRATKVDPIVALRYE